MQRRPQARRNPRLPAALERATRAKVAEALVAAPARSQTPQIDLRSQGQSILSSKGRPAAGASGQGLKRRILDMEAQTLYANETARQRRGMKGQKRPGRRLILGIIGTGWPGQQHARVMAAICSAPLYACADLDADTPGELRTDYAPAKLQRLSRDVCRTRSSTRSSFVCRTSCTSRLARRARGRQTCLLRETADDERGGNEGLAGRGDEARAGLFLGTTIPLHAGMRAAKE